MATSSQLDDQKVEFDLGSQTYCVDIEYVTEVANRKNITTIPSSPPHVRGMMDLRGQTTSIIDPKILFDVEETGDGESVLVFDPEEVDGEVAWIVDEVKQVSEIADDEIHDPPESTDAMICGVIRRGDEFIMWVDPEDASANP